MNASINIGIESEELSYYLKEVISDIASEEIRKMVKQQAEEMVRQEITRIVAPIVDSYLETAIVGREHFSAHDRFTSRREVDKFIKAIIMNYLDEPVYHYSKSDNTISGRYAHSASSGRETRAELWIHEKARKFVDTELFDKLESRLNEVAKKLIPSDEKMQEIIKQEVKSLFS
ncbi:hypothetical protein [Cohnella zeiphila]|uniref:Uncharacterized protein n=1 Tax=Cohnella zeiphila TaxID=2761120 RepID=A0A7X0SKX6_9BACL|nr:hypothetical protein [Cohnella zeiphila]MBB6731915.1 hypothetical protein [Cohnella zeiphila]